MPQCNGKGPAGHGAMTGRGAGCCGGNRTSRHGNGFSERDLDFTRGFGRGLGFGNDNQETSEKSQVETAISALKNQLQYLERKRDDLSK